MLPTPPTSGCSSTQSYSSDPSARLGHVIANRLRLTSVLGIGAYGTVYSAQDVTTGLAYAVKCLNKVGLDDRQRRFQEREIQLHHRASHSPSSASTSTPHPNIVRLEQIWDTPDCTYVVLEYCPEGDLFTKITEDGAYVGQDAKVRSVFLQILDAVRHCHAHGIYHRDLKPENILVRDDGWTAKLADFGLATVDRHTSDFGCGSMFYMSPECQNPTPTSYSAAYASAPNDVWSLGVILVNLVCGRNPWKRASLEDSTFRAFARDRNFLLSILPISHHLNYIIQRVFDLDPSRRLSLDALRECILMCPTLSRPTYESYAVDTPPLTPLGEEEGEFDSEDEDDEEGDFYDDVAMHQVPTFSALPPPCVPVQAEQPHPHQLQQTQWYTTPSVPANCSTQYQHTAAATPHQSQTPAPSTNSNAFGWMGQGMNMHMHVGAMGMAGGMGFGQGCWRGVGIF